MTKTRHENRIMEPVMAHNDDVERIAREILIHAAIIAGVCTLTVMVIP